MTVSSQVVTGNYAKKGMNDMKLDWNNELLSGTPLELAGRLGHATPEQCILAAQAGCGLSRRLHGWALIYSWNTELKNLDTTLRADFSDKLSVWGHKEKL